MRCDRRTLLNDILGTDRTLATSIAPRRSANDGTRQLLHPLPVLEALADRDREAKSAGIMLLPGAGFDVVPTDCLAAHLKRRVPSAQRLHLAIGGVGRFTRGTAKTMAEAAGRATLVRRNGRIVELRQTPRAAFDFGAGPRTALGVRWGNISTAWRSTAIPNIEVFFEKSPLLALAATMPGPARRLLAATVCQRFIKSQIEKRMPIGPTPEQRARSRCVVVGEAWDATGGHVISRIETIEAYTLTAWTSVEGARRALNGKAVSGFQTPATAFGADFILTFSGTTRQDL